MLKSREKEQSYKAICPEFDIKKDWLCMLLLRLSSLSVTRSLEEMLVQQLLTVRTTSNALNPSTSSVENS
jgi:hypothetical protein